MFHLLKINVLGRNSSPVEPIVQTPKLPFEILFAVIDEQVVAAESLTAREAALKDIGRMCRALATYCRAVCFRAVFLRSIYVDSSYTGEVASRMNTPEHFAQLIRHSPAVLAFIQCLSLHFDHRLKLPSPSVKERFWSALPGLNNIRGKEWLGILGAPYPQLRVLRLKMPAWTSLPWEIQVALIDVIRFSSCLESLELNVQECPINIFEVCTPTLKHLSFPRRFYSIPETRSAPKFDLSSVVLAERQAVLESYSFDGVFEQYCGQLLCFEPDGLLKHKGLKHLELGAIDGLLSYNAYTTFLQHSCSTLQCLHIKTSLFLCPHDHGHHGDQQEQEQDPDSQGQDAVLLVEPPSPLPLGSLPALKLLEVGVINNALTLGMQWLSHSIATIPSSEQSRSGLHIIIVVQRAATCACYEVTDAGAQQAHQENKQAWDGLVVKDAWPELNAVTMFAFSEPTVPINLGDQRHRAAPLPLGPHGDWSLSPDGRLLAYNPMLDTSCFCSKRGFRFPSA